MTYRTKRIGRRMNAAEIAFDLADKRVKAREAAGKQLAAERTADSKQQWGIDVDELERQGVEVTASIRGGHAAARRDDVFDRLLARQALSSAAHQAVRRLDADMTERRGDGASDRKLGERMGGSGTRDLVTQRMIDAAVRVDGVKDGVLPRVGLRDAALLRELLEPRQVMETADVERWRQVVAVVGGEARRDLQSKVVSDACEALVEAYREVDQQPRKAA